MLSDPTESEKIDFPKTLDIATVCVYGLGILSAGLFLFLPFVNLLHPSPWQRWLGTIHGFGSLLALVVIVYAGHLAFPLLRGSSKLLRQMRTLTFWSTVLAFLAISTGNLAYMRYRAGLEFGGARAWLKNRHSAHLHIFLYVFTFPKMFLRKTVIVENAIENYFQ
ncbi:MAG: hypothetical protein O9326_23535 [Microcystis sp. LE19-338.1B]|jgi:hypothetical protein|nr:hypothetical protein [Microcystis sp. LE19-338.1B]MCZ8359714.1 hypothetical protein [Microcystis sp. LE19-388.1G]